MTVLGKLPNLNLEKNGIRVGMPPGEVLRLFVAPHSREISIVPVLLAKVYAVSTIFLAIPLMIVFVVPIVVTLVMMFVSPHCHWGNQGGAQQEPA